MTAQPASVAPYFPTPVSAEALRYSHLLAREVEDTGTKLGSEYYGMTETVASVRTLKELTDREYCRKVTRGPAWKKRSGKKESTGAFPRLKLEARAKINRDKWNYNRCQLLAAEIREFHSVIYTIIRTHTHAHTRTPRVLIFLPSKIRRRERSERERWNGAFIYERARTR